MTCVVRCGVVCCPKLTCSVKEEVISLSQWTSGQVVDALIKDQGSRVKGQRSKVKGQVESGEVA